MSKMQKTSTHVFISNQLLGELSCL